MTDERLIEERMERLRLRANRQTRHQKSVAKIAELVTEIDQLREQVARLREYAEHKKDCNSVYEGTVTGDFASTKCNCGHYKLMDETAAAEW